VKRVALKISQENTAGLGCERAAHALATYAHARAVHIITMMNAFALSVACEHSNTRYLNRT
jgi:hypothetical protein